jgi:modification methylase
LASETLLRLPQREETCLKSEAEPFETNIIHAGNCSSMVEIPDGVIDLIISGPPYWSYIDYHAFTKNQPHIWQGSDTYDQYLSNLEKWHRECFRVLRPGRFCIVVLGTLGKDGKTYPIPFDALPIIQKIGFNFEYEIIWNKISGGRQSARNYIRHRTPGKFHPNIRTEYVFVLRKEPNISFLDPDNLMGGSGDIEVDDFFVREVANNIWNIPPRNLAKEKQHPCPFPIELPYRLVELFSIKGEVVLDPFMGIGTTAKAAKMLGRKFVGYEVEESFRNAALKYIDGPDEKISKMTSEFRHW